MSSALDGFATRGLWSLWDMREHNAKLWLRTTKQILRTIALVRVTEEGKLNLKNVAGVFEAAAKQCGENGLSVSEVMALESHLVLSKSTTMLNSLVIDELEGLHSTIEGELRSILFLRIGPEFAKYYREKQLFGEIVPDKFPSAIQDIEHGGKALAAGLGTAAVFHMMRVMEVVLKSLAKALKIPYAPSWESYLTQIEKKITAKHKTKTINWKKEEPYFRDILGDLQMVKMAWRNPTMHIVRQYEQDEAEDIFRGVRRFVMRMSERFGE